MVAEVVIVRKEHPCSARGCNQTILVGHPAVTIRLKTINATGEKWKTNYFHLPCREAETGEKVRPPTYQLTFSI